MLEATLHGLCWLAGFWMLWRLAALPKGDAPIDFSVVIPARDEAGRLPALLESLQNQSHRPLEILVIDDHSTDGTADVARRGGARGIASAPLPAGWRGKTWACQQGAREARGAWLLFLDADLRLLPDALARIAAALKNGGALSVLPHHRTVRWVEDLSGIFNLVQAAASNAFTPRGNKATPKRMFGPLMAISREEFWKGNGYEPVKDRWVENFDLSAALEARGVPLACYAGKGAVEFRMYDGGIAAIAAGWGKSFAMGGKGTPVSIWVAFSLWLTGALGAARALVAAFFPFDGTAFLFAGLIYALFAVQTGLWLRRLGSFRWATVLAYPVPAVFFVFVFFRSLIALAFGRPLVWKGRTNQ
jgi:4,4'-diaponeurosporenoate glycosyltransferase